VTASQSGYTPAFRSVSTPRWREDLCVIGTGNPRDET
jgi:hypothetical protein